MSSTGFKSLYANLGLKVNPLTNQVKKETKFTTVSSQVPHLKGYNLMIDTLSLPETQEGYKHLVIAVDLGNNAFDMEPIANNIDSDDALQALKAMYKRGYISKPKASIASDGGAEYAGHFDTYCYNNGILHKVALKNRHTQLSNINNLTLNIGRIINAFLNKKEEQLGHVYREWAQYLPKIRTELNKHRITKEIDPRDEPFPDLDDKAKPKFKVGDVVYRLLNTPQDAQGNEQPTSNFRAGDYRYEHTIPRVVQQVLPYSGNIPFRYVISGIKNASFTDRQLKLAHKPQPRLLEQIINKTKAPIRYEVTFKGEPRSALLTGDQLIKLGYAQIVDKFNRSIRLKRS